MRKAMYLNSELFDNNDFIIIKKYIKAGDEYPLHWHDYFEFEIITSGCVEHMHNQNKYIAGDGNAYLMSYYDFHSFKAITDTNLIVIHFNENALSDELSKFIFLGIRKFNCVYNKFELENIMVLVKKIEAENEQGLLFNRQIIANTLSELVINIIRKSGTGTETHMSQPIQEAVIYLLKNFRDDISLSSLAETLHLSANYLGVLFKENTGVSFREYLNTIRLKHACRLLISSSLSVKEVSYTSGYKTHEHFLRIFRQNFNMTPSEYRCKNLE
ncbi:MAG: AraC family transcriptional regulator [Clostridiales bacterium]|nr:AraC family transcriptional regulator [Clostridiales bacterium]